MQISTKRASTKPFLKLTAADLMSKPIVTIRCDMLLRDAGHLLIKQAISGAPVVDADGNCVGVLSAADFIAPAEPRGEAGQRHRCSPIDCLKTVHCAKVILGAAAFLLTIRGLCLQPLAAVIITKAAALQGSWGMMGA